MEVSIIFSPYHWEQPGMSTSHRLWFKATPSVTTAVSSACQMKNRLFKLRKCKRKANLIVTFRQCDLLIQLNILSSALLELTLLKAAGELLSNFSKLNSRGVTIHSANETRWDMILDEILTLLLRKLQWGNKWLHFDKKYCHILVLQDLVVRDLVTLLLNRLKMY